MPIHVSLAQRAAVLGLLALCAACRQEAPPEREPPLPTLSGTIIADGLSAPVQVVRDASGVPHISAGSQDDLFFAQGFVQAQDRLFQMDLWRRGALGRLAEVLGPNFIERDAMTRRVQYRGDMQSEWASYAPDARAIAAAFTRGINAWVAEAREALPEEFALAGWVPEFWQPEDLLSRTDAFVASANASEEIFRAQLAAAVGMERLNAIMPAGMGPGPSDAGVDPGTISPTVAEILRRVGAPPVFSGFARPFGTRPTPATSRPAAGPTMDPPDGVTGSNAWAVGRTPAGGPLLAVDPHRPLDSPSPRYLVHLRAPGWHVAGATLPWMPGVAIGHNEHMAWGMTASSADTQDVYVEALNPANARQVRSNGEWVDIVVRRDAILVKGRAEPFEYEQLFTPRGVIVALDRERRRAYAVRWSGTEPGGAAELAALGIGRARSVEEFRSGLRRWKMPTAEFVYADVEGRIGRQMAGLVPLRVGGDGLLPVRGDSLRLDWNGWAEFDSPVPSVGGRGFVASANASVARLTRISEVLSDPKARTVLAMERLQQDVTSTRAARLVPLLTRVRADREDAERARGRLLAWDRRVSADSAEAALYVFWERALLRMLAAHRIPGALAQEYVARQSALLVDAAARPTNTWFDRGEADRNRLLLDALNEAVGQLKDRPDARWGTIHQVTFTHPLGITDTARRRFNVGPFAMPGYADTVMSIAVPEAGSGRSGAPIRGAGASFRAVFDLADWDRSRVMNAPGQSERAAGPHFSDLATLWAAGDSLAFPFSAAAVAASARATLTLTPRLNEGR